MGVSSRSKQSQKVSQNFLCRDISKYGLLPNDHRNIAMNLERTSMGKTEKVAEVFSPTVHSNIFLKREVMVPYA